MTGRAHDRRSTVRWVLRVAAALMLVMFVAHHIATLAESEDQVSQATVVAIDDVATPAHSDPVSGDADVTHGGLIALCAALLLVAVVAAVHASRRVRRVLWQEDPSAAGHSARIPASPSSALICLQLPVLRC